MKIKIIGIGGYGANFHSRLSSDILNGAEYIQFDTDSNLLTNTTIPNKILLDKNNLTTNETTDIIKQNIQNSDLIIIIAAMGGIAGTTISPIVAKIAQEAGIFSIVLTTTPFLFEYITRGQNAKKGIENLKQYADILKVFSNQDIFNKQIDNNIKQSQMFEIIDSPYQKIVETICHEFKSTNIKDINFDNIKNIIEQN